MFKTIRRRIIASIALIYPLIVWLIMDNSRVTYGRLSANPSLSRIEPDELLMLGILPSLVVIAALWVTALPRNPKQ